MAKHGVKIYQAWLLIRTTYVTHHMRAIHGVVDGIFDERL
jgi:hypothetical protein